MALFRRDFLKAALSVMAIPFVQAVLNDAQAQPQIQPQIHPQAGSVTPTSKLRRIDYTGADNPSAFEQFVDSKAAGKVAIVVFHAKWCGACKQYFHDLENIAQEDGDKFVVIGLDVGPMNFPQGPYKKIVAAHNVFATPVTQYYVDGNQHLSRAGSCANAEDLGRYLRDLHRSLKSLNAVHVQAPQCNF